MLRSMYNKSTIPKELDLRLQNLGYWLVDNEYMFINKYQALEYCTANNTNNIKYQVEPDVFNNQNWAYEPTESLQELYRQRAQQLRDTYDYLVVTFSGGSDSVNILHSFFENNIWPDEIMTWMVKGPGFKDNEHGANTEIYYNQDLLKQFLKKKNIKFTVLPINEEYDKIFNDDWGFHGDVSLRASQTARGYSVYNNRYRSLVHQGKKCGIVYGLDKPNVVINNDGSFASYFQDSNLAQLHNTANYDLTYDSLTKERFYVSGDFPQLTIKQSHVMANFLQNFVSDKNKKKFYIGKTFDNDLYKNLCIDVLYSHSFDRHSTFTLGKNTTIFGQRDDWVWQLDSLDPRKQGVLRGWKSIRDNIDIKYFNNKNWQKISVGCISDFFHLGKIVQYKKTASF